jgi:hypothetical protein
MGGGNTGHAKTKEEEMMEGPTEGCEGMNMAPGKGEETIDSEN